MGIVELRLVAATLEELEGAIAALRTALVDRRPIGLASAPRAVHAPGCGERYQIAMCRTTEHRTSTAAHKRGQGWRTAHTARARPIARGAPPLVRPSRPTSHRSSRSAMSPVL